MPAKHKNLASKVKSSSQKVVDQVDLIDKALGECNGLQDWIADVLEEVKQIKDKNDNSESAKHTEKLMAASKSKTEQKFCKRANKSAGGRDSFIKSASNGSIIECNNNNSRTSNRANGANKSLTRDTKTKEKPPKAASNGKNKKPPSSPTAKQLAAAQSTPANKAKTPSKSKKVKSFKKPGKTSTPKPIQSALLQSSDMSSCCSSTSSSNHNNNNNDSSSNSMHEILADSEGEAAAVAPLLDVEALSLLGRSSRECLASYSMVNKRYIEVKRSMESLMVDLNRVSVIMNRQRNVFHGGLMTANSKTQVCHH